MPIPIPPGAAPTNDGAPVGLVFPRGTLLAPDIEEFPPRRDIVKDPREQGNKIKEWNPRHHRVMETELRALSRRTQPTAEEKPKKGIIDKRGKRGAMKKREEGNGGYGQKMRNRTSDKSQKRNPTRPPMFLPQTRKTFTANLNSAVRVLDNKRARNHKQLAKREVTFKGEPNDWIRECGLSI